MSLVTRLKIITLLNSQVSRQKDKTSVEKDFYKLMNNSNFRYDCRSNIDNCTFAPLNDEVEEISYLKSTMYPFD